MLRTKLSSRLTRKQLLGLKRLLLAEARSLASLRQIAREQFEYVEDEESIRKATERAASQFEQALLVARMDARAQSKAQAIDELESFVEVEAFTEEDRTRSHLLGNSTAAALGMAALILLRQDKPKPGLIAIGHADYKLRRLAATEVANAYSRAHYDVQVPDPSFWLRRWDATLDKRVCKFCASMDGQTVALDEDFPDGLMPGDVHPNCRCVVSFIPLALMKAA